MIATSKLTVAERAKLLGETIAHDIWSIHKTSTGRFMSCVTELFIRSVTQSMTIAVRDAAMVALIDLADGAEGDYTKVTRH